jgi:hypothetical protein
MRFKKSIFGGLAMLPLVGLLSLTGNSGVMAAPVEAATGTAEDHLAAAMRYQTKAQELGAEAAEFKAVASKIGHYEDTKGFRRGALTMAAQQKQSDANEMQKLYATHMRQANALLGKVQPQ